MVKKWDESGKNSGLIIQINMPQYGDKRRKYQASLNKKIEQIWPKDDNWSISGVQTRKAPTMLINIARRKDLREANRTLSKTKWYDKLSEEDLRRIKASE